MTKLMEFVALSVLLFIAAAIALFAMPYWLVWLGIRTGSGTSVESAATRYRPYLRPAAVWGGVAAALGVFVVAGMQATDLLALATGIGVAIGALPAAPFQA